MPIGEGVVLTLTVGYALKNHRFDNPSNREAYSNQQVQLYLLSQDIIIILAVLLCLFRHKLLFYEINALAVNLDIEHIYSSITSMGNNYC